jgi:hypothetical protein
MSEDWNNKEYVLKNIKGPYGVNKISMVLRDDHEVGKKIVTVWKDGMKYLSPKLRSDKNFVLYAANLGRHLVRYANPELKTAFYEENPNLKDDYTDSFGTLYNDIYYKNPDKIYSEDWNNKEFVLKKINIPSNILKISMALRDDLEVGKNIVKACTEGMKYLSPKLRSDKDFVLYAVNLDRSLVQYANPVLKTTFYNENPDLKDNYTDSFGTLYNDTYYKNPYTEI